MKLSTGVIVRSTAHRHIDQQDIERKQYLCRSLGPLDEDNY